MRYLFAFLIPPLSVLMCNRPGQAALNLIFWLISIPAIFFLGLGLIGWLFCTIHALAACKASSIDKRLNRVIDAIQTNNR